LQEYQNKEPTNFVFHKHLILKGMFVVEQSQPRAEKAAEKKAGVRLPLSGHNFL
jgi:hypothetical protein